MVPHLEHTELILVGVVVAAGVHWSKKTNTRKRLKGIAWFKSCGGVSNKNVDRRWSEGVKACKRKFKVDQWHVVYA
jgi:hypothetical protein